MENNGVHFLCNAILIEIGRLQIVFLKFWQKTEQFKFPIHIHWINIKNKT